MPSGEPIRDASGKILGYLEGQSNGDIVARDFYGRILGKYDSAFDVTRDFYGRIVFKGNQAVGLITMFKEE